MRHVFTRDETMKGTQAAIKVRQRRAADRRREAFEAWELMQAAKRIMRSQR